MAFELWREEFINQVEFTLTNHPPETSVTSDVLDIISAGCRELGRIIVASAPEPSRELSLALTKLQETRMFAIAAVVLHQEAYDGN